MARSVIKDIEGAAPVVQRFATTGTATSTPSVGSMNIMKEGIIQRVRVEVKNNLSYFDLGLYESDPTSDVDGVHCIAYYRVDEPNHSLIAAGDSTKYVLDEVDPGIYYLHVDAAPGRSSLWGKLWYRIFTDSASASTVDIRLDIQVTA